MANDMKQKYCTFYIVRHGQTEWNAQGRYQGQKDSPLTELGVQQAKKIAQRFKDHSFDAIFSSDLLRAKRTAEFIALEHDMAVETKAILRERNFGSLEGIVAKEARQKLKESFDKFDILTPEEQFRYKYVPDMESDEELATRFITFLREAAISYAGKTILVVCHGGIMRATLNHLGFASLKQLPTGSIENTAYFVLKSDGVDFFIEETVGIHKKHDR
jgi:broad specificity phosphatase PhoE